MILRNFLFLDTATMVDYLAVLEGYTVEGPIEQTEAEKKGIGGKAGYKVIEAEKASETSTETKRRLTMTEAAQFQRLYEILEEQNLIQSLDAFDAAIWAQIRKGELLEIEASVQLPEPFMLTRAIEDISPLLDIMAAFDQDPLSDPKARTAFEGVRAITKLAENKPIPLLFEAVSTPGFRFVSHLPRKFLRCALADLQGEMTVFGKAHRILDKSEKLEVFSLFPDLTSLPNLNREQRRKIQRDMSKKNLAEVIRGPAIVLAPIAIYR